MAAFIPTLRGLVSFALARGWVVGVALCRRRRGVNWNRSFCREAEQHISVHRWCQIACNLAQAGLICSMFAVMAPCGPPHKFFDFAHPSIDSCVLVLIPRCSAFGNVRVPPSVFATISRITYVVLRSSNLFLDVSFFPREVLMELYGSGAPSSQVLAAPNSFSRSG